MIGALGHHETCGAASTSRFVGRLRKLAVDWYSGKTLRTSRVPSARWCRCSLFCLAVGYAVLSILIVPKSALAACTDVNGGTASATGGSNCTASFSNYSSATDDATFSNDPGSLLTFTQPSVTLTAPAGEAGIGSVGGQVVSTGLIDITSLGRGIRSVFTNSLITLHDFTANTVDDGIAADRRATVVIDGSQVSIVTTGADAKGLLADRGAKIFIDPAGGTGSLSFDSFVRLNTAGASISTQGDDAHGIQSRANAGNADIEFLQGSIETTGDSAEGAYALINGGTGAATITMSGGSVTTGGEDSEGLVALVQPFGGGDATATLSGGQVTTTGDGSTGVLAQANLGGDARAEQSDGTIQTAGDAASHGLLAFSGLGNATTNQSGGSTSTTGADSHALYAAASAANASITQAASGTAEASGQNSAGVRAEALGTAAISVAGLVSGGWDTAAGIEARGFAGSTVNIASSSSVGALSDRAILGSFNSPTDITSAGILTGFVDLAGGDDSFANSGRWNVRNWADTTGDGMRDTIGVATSDFGGGTDLFTNTGTVALARCRAAAESKRRCSTISSASRMRAC